MCHGACRCAADAVVRANAAAYFPAVDCIAVGVHEAGDGSSSAGGVVTFVPTTVRPPGPSLSSPAAPRSVVTDGGKPVGGDVDSNPDDRRFLWTRDCSDGASVSLPASVNSVDCHPHQALAVVGLANGEVDVIMPLGMEECDVEVFDM